jgi:hypothetical protein
MNDPWMSSGCRGLPPPTAATSYCFRVARYSERSGPAIAVSESGMAHCRFSKVVPRGVEPLTTLALWGSIRKTR